MNTFETTRTIRKPVTAKMPPRLTDGMTHPVITRTVDQPKTTVLLAVLDEAEIAMNTARTGSRGICGCGAPATKVVHFAGPKWIHDANPEVAHPVAAVRCITRP